MPVELGIIVKGRNGFVSSVFSLNTHIYSDQSTDAGLAVGSYVEFDENGIRHRLQDIDTATLPFASPNPVTGFALLHKLEVVFPGHSLPYGPLAAWSPIVGWIKKTSHEYKTEFRHERVIMVTAEWNDDIHEWTIPTYSIEPTDIKIDEFMSPLDPSVFKTQQLDVYAMPIVSLTAKDTPEAVVHLLPPNPTSTAWPRPIGYNCAPPPQPYSRPVIESIAPSPPTPSVNNSISSEPEMTDWISGIVMSTTENLLFVHTVWGTALLRQRSRNDGNGSAELGSFLKCRLTHDSSDLGPCSLHVECYRVVPPELQFKIIKSGSRGLSGLEFRVRCEILWEGENELIEGGTVFYGTNDFFGKIYDSHTYPLTYVDGALKGRLMVWIRRIRHPNKKLDSSLMQIIDSDICVLEKFGVSASAATVDVENASPRNLQVGDDDQFAVSSEFNQLSFKKMTTNLVPSTGTKQFIGFVSSGTSPQYIASKSFDLDVIIPPSVLCRYQDPYKLLGKWVAFDATMVRGRYEVYGPVEELPEPLLPTKVMARFVDVQTVCWYTGEKSPTGKPRFYSQDVSGPIDDVAGVMRPSNLLLGARLLWVSRENSVELAWRVSSRHPSGSMKDTISRADCASSYDNVCSKFRTADEANSIMSTVLSVMQLDVVQDIVAAFDPDFILGFF